MQLILVIYFHHEPHFSSPFITKGKPFPPTQTISRLRRCSVPIAELRKSVHSNRGSNLIKDASQDCLWGGPDLFSMFSILHVANYLLSVSPSKQIEIQNYVMFAIAI